jgi:drug/metabolite transporter (DMT)-like permease
LSAFIKFSTLKLKPVYTYIIVVLSMVFWGMSFVWSKIVLEFYDPVTTVLLRLILSSIMIFTGLKLFYKIQKIKKDDYLLFAMSSLFNPFLYFLGENYGLQLSTPTTTSVIIATIPVFTPILAFIIYRERLSFLNIAGLFTSFIGVLFMLVNQDLSFNASPKGVSWLTLAVMSAVLYSILLKKLAMKYDAFRIIATQNMIGAIYFLPLFFIFDVEHFVTVTPSFGAILSLILLAFFASSLAYVFFTISSREIGISKTNLFTNLIPVFTTIFSFFILNELFDAKKIVGMVIVIVGVLMSQINKNSGFHRVSRVFQFNFKKQ